MVKMVLEVDKTSIGVMGMGYVGLPLIIAFSKRYNCIGYDIDEERIKELNNCNDDRSNIDYNLIRSLIDNNSLTFSTNSLLLSKCDVIIVTVPTPVDENKNPDLTLLINACEIIGGLIRKKQIIVFESTVYPGCTEEICIPIIERISGLQINIDFHCGYSPERINPGDTVNTVETIIKVTSGSNEWAASFIDKLYASVVNAGTYKAPSIKVAEASKAIENAQRDINISFVNELSLIFDKLNIDTYEVLKAAETKWNFLPFKPGLVGGHCIGVDPYYLAFKAKQVGHEPQVILSGRHVNDQMSTFVALKLAKLLRSRHIKIEGAAVLILGITFKGNCNDIRNSKVVDVYRELSDLGIQVEVNDPYANPADVHNLYQINLVDQLGVYDAILLAVDHDCFKIMDISKLKRQSNSVVFDLKGVLPTTDIDARL
jgi:UDP-N-acetyl-D-galactosamine dehydrogenase